MSAMTKNMRSLFLMSAVAFGVGFGLNATPAWAVGGTCCFVDTCRCDTQCLTQCVGFDCDAPICDDQGGAAENCYLCDD